MALTGFVPEVSKVDPGATRSALEETFNIASWSSSSKTRSYEIVSPGHILMVTLSANEPP